MGAFSTQTGGFDYSLSFRQDTGVYDWVFGLNYEETTETLWSNPVESENLSGLGGISESVAYKNGTLFLGNPTEEVVEVYQSDITDRGVFKGNFTRVNSLIPYQVDDASGFGLVLHPLNNNCFIGAPEGAGAIFYYNRTLTGAQGSTETGAWGQSTSMTGTETGGAFGCSFSSRTSSITPIVGVGASGELSGSGNMYIYDGLDASIIMELNPPTISGVQQFGRSQAACVAEGLGCIAVGYDDNGTGKINIYKESVARANDYSFFQTLSGSEALYGITIKGSGPNIMVGSPSLGSSGVVYWYSFSSESGIFILNQTLTPDNLAGGDHFGKSLDFDSSIAIIGSDGNLGSAYIYEWDISETLVSLSGRARWTERSQVSGSPALTPGSFAGNSLGSQSVIADGTRVIIGTETEGDTYIFETGIPTSEGYSGMAFSGSGNKIYDSDGNFLYGYGPNRMCVISGGVFTGGYYSMFINGNLCRAQAPREAGSGFSGALNDWSTQGFGGMTSYFLEISSSPGSTSGSLS